MVTRDTSAIASNVVQEVSLLLCRQIRWKFYVLSTITRHATGSMALSLFSAMNLLPCV
jgi:hypothetical protein